MTRTEVVALIAARVGQRTDLDNTIITEMALVIATELEESSKVHPWFLMTTKSDLLTVQDDEAVALPTGFIIEVEQRSLRVYDPVAAKWVAMKKAEYEELDDEYVDASTAMPEKYAIEGLSFLVRPVPDAGYNLRLRYYRKDPLSVLTEAGETLWLKYAPDLVIALTARAVAKGQLHDYELAASFDGDGARAWARLSVLNEERQHIAMTYEMGED